MNTKPYEELKDRQREEFNNFPIAYAFNEKQLVEALAKLGAKKEECVSVFGHGDIVKKEDAPKLLAMMKRHDQEVREFILKDYDLAVGAFLAEMNNHEYCINWEGDENVLGCFMLDFKKLRELGLEEAYSKARREHMRIAHEEWEVI